jgi:GT2 family glycosyltransferase/glycosyltransferase involved in cell wall biosynthesis
MAFMVESKSLVQIANLRFGEEIEWAARRLVLPGPWAGHIPFARWLVKASKPRLLVELGTHTGNSFSAFCQAIDTLGLQTQAYAVDSWAGDSQTGYYDTNVYDELNTFISANYSQFATLLQSNFDDAITKFMPGSIDILHIDGLHTYEAVKHDYLTWFDLLSDRALVLFHDTRVRDRDFGVWRLWHELSALHPSFEFTHSNGLGILAVGKNLEGEIAEFFSEVQGHDIAWRIRALFASRGRRFELSTELMAVRHEALRQAQAVRQENVRQAAIRREMEVRFADLMGRISRLEELLEQAKASGQGLQNELDALQRSISAGVDVATNDRRLLEGQRDKLAAEIAFIKRSTSWRVTAPVRVLGRTVKSAVRTTRRVSLKIKAAVGNGMVKETIISASDNSEPSARAPEAPNVSNLSLENTQQCSRENLTLDFVTTLNTTLRDSSRALMKNRLNAFFRSEETLYLPNHCDPDVSIILVLYNQVELTYACLSAIRECLSHSKIKVEVVIVNNASTDLTPELLRRTEGAKIINSEENLHFLRGVNLASRECVGSYLLFLNNDAQITLGAVESAIETIKLEKDVGAVGARLILPDGKLQEAGSIIWADGSCTGYGRGDNPDDAKYMFRKDVDYCSGAFLLTSRELFESVGGFDTAFEPAYYEETDYCVRIWKRGLRVIYDPKVVVHHFEFGSSTSEAVTMNLQRKNQLVFQERHQEWLSYQFAPSAENLFLASRRMSTNSNILFIEDRVPAPWLGSGFPRSASILQHLGMEGLVLTIFTTAEENLDWNEIWRTIPAGTEVISQQQNCPDLETLLSQRKGYYSGIFVTRPHNMRLLKEVQFRNPSLFDGINVVYDAEAVFARREILKNKLNATPMFKDDQEKLLNDELELTAGANLVISVSEDERDLILKAGPKLVKILGHAVVPNPTLTAFSDRTDLVFLGAVHFDDSPNADSIRWFVQKILPKLRKLLNQESLKLKIIGYVRAPSILSIDKDLVELVGPVSDLKPFFEVAKVAVVPTRFAAGIPHKVHQIASYGVPLVVTELIASQVRWAQGSEVLIGSEPRDFAHRCAQLFTDEELWNRLRDAALLRLRQDCSPATFAETASEVATVLRNPARKKTR